MLFLIAPSLPVQVLRVLYVIYFLLDEFPRPGNFSKCTMSSWPAHGLVGRTVSHITPQCFMTGPALLTKWMLRHFL